MTDATERRCGTWTLAQFRVAGRRRGGRPAQDDYRPWTDAEIETLRTHKGEYGGYRRAAAVLGRSYLSVKHMGGRI